LPLKCNILFGLASSTTATTPEGTTDGTSTVAREALNDTATGNYDRNLEILLSDLTPISM